MPPRTKSISDLALGGSCAPRAVRPPRACICKRAMIEPPRASLPNYVPGSRAALQRGGRRSRVPPENEPCFVEPHGGTLMIVPRPAPAPRAPSQSSSRGSHSNPALCATQVHVRSMHRQAVGRGGRRGGGCCGGSLGGNAGGAGGGGAGGGGGTAMRKWRLVTLGTSGGESLTRP